jgi:GTPase
MSNPAVKTMVNEVRSVLRLADSEDRRPPIVLTEAIDGTNIPELWEKLEEHRTALERDGQLEARRRRNLAAEVFALASSRARMHLEGAVRDDAELARVLEAVEGRKLDPLSAVHEILEKVFRIED